MDLKVIIQARTGSTRLPQKMIKPFFRDKTILQLLVERLNKYLDCPIWVATTDSEIDDELVSSLSKFDVKIFRGSENDVLSRYREILEKNYSEYFIRVCGDNPFLNVNYLRQLIDAKDGFDYISFYEGKIPVIKTHYGVFAEVIRSETIMNLNSQKLSEEIREHVTPFLYRNESVYNLKKLELPEELKSIDNIRLTVDTKGDFKLAQDLYKNSRIENDHSDYDLKRLLSLIKENSDYQQKMKRQIEENLK